MKKRVMVCCLMLIVLLMTGISQLAFAAAPEPRIEIEFDKESVKVGDELTMTYRITGEGDFYDLLVTFNAGFEHEEDYMEVDRFRVNGPFESEGQYTVTVPNVKEISAYVQFVEDDGRDEVYETFYSQDSVIIPVTDYIEDEPEITVRASQSTVGAEGSVKIEYKITGSKEYSDVWVLCWTEDKDGATSTDCGELLYNLEDTGVEGSFTVSPACGDYLMLGFNFVDSDGRFIYREVDPGIVFTGDTCKRPEVEISFSPNPVKYGEEVTASYRFTGDGKYTDVEWEWWVQETYGSHSKNDWSGDTDQLEGTLSLTPDFGDSVFLDFRVYQDNGKSHYFSWIVEGHAPEDDERFRVKMKGYAEGFDKYTVLEGAGQIGTGNEDMLFRANVGHGDFEGIMVDGEYVEEDLYGDASSNGTLVTLYNEYLKTLPSGSHELVIAFEDGVAVTTFTLGLPATPTNKIGDIVEEEDFTKLPPVDAPILILPDGVVMDTSAYLQYNEPNANGNNTVVYNVHLVDREGVELELPGECILCFPYPEGMDENSANKFKIIIHHYGSKGKETFNSKDGTIELTKQGLCIRISSFSPFEITWEEMPEEIELPKTGDESLPMGFLLLMMAVSLCGLGLMAKRKHN